MRTAVANIFLAALMVFVAFSGPIFAQQIAQHPILRAQFSDPTDRYDHGILGDAIEFGALILDLGPCPECTDSPAKRLRIRLPKDRVFEDLEPRLVDLDGDGINEVIVVETSLSKGAQLAVYGAKGKIAATPFLGRPYRWLAPVGAADLDGDGRIEIAYVEKPHLTKILKIWRLENGDLRQITSLQGLTNHRIGEDFITGGIRNCGQGPEIITVDGNWSNIMATSLHGTKLTSRTLGAFQGAASISAAMKCPS